MKLPNNLIKSVPFDCPTSKSATSLLAAHSWHGTRMFPCIQLPQLMSEANRAFVLSVLFAVSGCSGPVDIGPPAKSSQATVSERIAFKAFSTGQVASDELKNAKDEPYTWTYFAEPRIINYETLADGTVVEIEFGLKNSWEGYKLRDELERKFKASSAPFRFQCVSKDGSVDFTDKRFRVTDENCYAFDETQTLVIARRWPKYEEPLLEQFPSLKLLVDRGSVTLYDQNLRTAKAEADRRRLHEEIAEDAKRAAKDM